MIHELRDLAATLPKGTRLLGLDVGTKTIGLAVSDPGLVVASPIGTVRRTRLAEDVRELARPIRDYGIGGLVVGLPLNMDGSSGPRAQSTRQFAENLLARADLLGWEPRIAFWDERLSTAAVQRFMTGEADMTRKRRGEVVDKMAAAYILQGALDSLAYQRRLAEEALARENDEDRDDEDRDDEDRDGT